MQTQIFSSDSKDTLVSGDVYNREHCIEHSIIFSYSTKQRSALYTYLKQLVLFYFLT